MNRNTFSLHNPLNAFTHLHGRMQLLVCFAAVCLAVFTAFSQSSDSTVVYHLRTDKDIYEFGERVVLIHSVHVGGRPVTLYKFLEPGEIHVNKVYGAMDVPAPASEILKSRTSPTLPLKAGKTLEQRGLLEGFGKSYPGTAIRYLEPTVYRIAIRFYYRVEGNTTQTFVCGDSVFFTVRRNDLVERVLHDYYPRKDSCMRLESSANRLSLHPDSLASCSDRLIDSCMHARASYESPLLQEVLLYDYLRHHSASQRDRSGSGTMGARLIEQYLARNQGRVVPEYLRLAMEEYRK
jgi:hypothetical protein